MKLRLRLLFLALTVASSSRVLSMGRQGSVAAGWAFHIDVERPRGFGDRRVSEDGKLILTAGRDLTARIWRVADGAPLVTLEGHDAALSSAALSPNGNYVVTTSAADHTVRLWDVASGREIATLADKQRTGKTDPLPANAVFNKKVPGSCCSQADKTRASFASFRHSPIFFNTLMSLRHVSCRPASASGSF